jgi:hypothetical protein
VEGEEEPEEVEGYEQYDDEEVPWLCCLEEGNRQSWRTSTKAGSMPTQKSEAGRKSFRCPQVRSGFHLLEDDCDDELNACAEETDASRGTGWVKVTAVVDSGAVDNVIPEQDIPFVPLEQTERSKAGRGFRGPGGEPIPTSGQRTTVIKTSEGQTRKTKWQVCPVKRALMSVAKLTEAGNTVHMSRKDPHILNEKTKEKTSLRKEGNVYVVDLWIKMPRSPVQVSKTLANKMKICPNEAEDVDMGHLKSGFARQGR